MKEASKAFIGTYDFRSFCANKRMKKSTVRTITGIDFCEKDGILIIPIPEPVFCTTWCGS
mgnify:CR=1 FL=1